MDKLLHQRGIQVPLDREPIEKLEGFMGRTTFVVASITRDGIVDIDNRGYEAELAELVSHSPVRIASTIHPLMMFQGWT